MQRIVQLLCLAIAAPFVFQAQADESKPTPIAEVKHEGPVNFEKEILPILRRNCLACHNATDAESDLVLETPEAMMKGGYLGPAIVPGKGGESLLLKVAALQEEPFMPPADNSSGAKNLTSEELGLLKLWIDQGAKGEVSGLAAPVQWQSLPPGVNPIYAVSVTPDGRFAAAGRANQIFLYNLSSKTEVGRLTDPAMMESKLYEKPGVAHLDLVQSLAFSDDGLRLASGGYRTVKIWRRPVDVRKAELAGVDSPPRAVATSADSKWSAIAQENGAVKVFKMEDGKVAHTLSGHSSPVTSAAFTVDGGKLVTGSADKSFRVWSVADGKEIARIETPAEVTAVAWINPDQEIATGGSDNIIRTWALPGAKADEQAKKEEESKEGKDSKEEAKPEPLQEIKGHGGPVTSLAVFAKTPTTLVSGSQDGTLRLWNLGNGSQIRSMGHGGPVTDVAARVDGERFVSVSSNGAAKLWDSNGKQLAEMKGDFRLEDEAGSEKQSADLAKRIVDVVKKDLEAAKKRKESEDENAKKADEEKKKAEEEQKKKAEAAKKPVADKEAADKDLAEAMKAQTDAEAAKKAAEQAQVKANEAHAKAQQELSEADKALAEAVKAFEQAKQASEQAEAAAKKDSENNDLASAAEEAKKVLAEAEQKKKAAEEMKAAKEKAEAEAAAKKKEADEDKKNKDQALADATNKVKQAEANAKKLEAPAKKAADELAAADRALAAAERSVKRAATSVERAEELVAQEEAALKQAEESHKAATADSEKAQKASTESEKPVSCVAFSPDGKLFATGGEAQTVFLWDSETGAPVQTCSGQGAAIVDLSFTGGGHVLSVAANNTAVVWDAQPAWILEKVIGSPNSSEHFVDRVTALDFSSDGKLLAAGGGEPSRSGEIKIFNVESGELVRAFDEPHSDTVFGLEFSPDDVHLASCGADRFMKVFETATGKMVKSFEGHTHHVLGVAWQADGRMLATGGADNVVKVWNFRTGEQHKSIGGYSKEVTSVEYAGIGTTVAASAGDKTVRLNDADRGRVSRTISGGGDFMFSVDVTGDGKTIVAGGQDSVLRVWNDNGQSVVNFEPPKDDDQVAQAAK